MAEKMKAVRKTRPEPGLELVEIDIPQIKPDEVLLKVEATAICGSDIHFYNWDAYAQSRIKPPLTIGHEFAGEIVEVGKAVKHYKVGDYATGDSHIACGNCDVCKIGLQHICQNLKIFGNEVDGSFAEYMAVPEGSLWRLDRSVPSEVGAIMEPLGGAVQAALIEPVTAQSVVVFGDGPIGLFAVGVAAVAGASKVSLVGIVPSRLDVARQMGASSVYNALEDKHIVEKILDETHGLGVDVVLEMSGAHSALKDAFRHRSQGRPGDAIWSEPRTCAGIRFQLQRHLAPGEGARCCRQAHVGYLAGAGWIDENRKAGSSPGDNGRDAAGAV